MSRIAIPLSLLFALILLSESALQAQRTDAPRTRTLPGIESPAFPYAQPEDVGLSSDALERLGDEVAGWVANGDVVGAELLIIKAGRAVFHEAYGWGDRERKEPVERNAIWSIKSMSKPVTATAVLMLAEEGKLSLDDPVSRYIPGFAGDRRTTVRHLLAQTSGDGGGHGGGGNVYFFDSLRDWVTDWAVQKPTATFGEFRYSNFNYAALGYIVELVAGVPVETFTERRILQPLGMTDTYTVFTPAAAWAERVPSRYRWDQEALQYERYWSNRDLQPWTFYPAALGLWGTAMDYARFMSMWLNRGEYEGARLLAERTAETALEPHGFLGAEGLYGYGWFVEAAAGGGMPRTFRHGGADGTVAFAVPEDDAMVIYLSHSGARGQNALQNRVAMLGLFEYPGPWMAWAKESGVVAVRLTPEERTSYTGTYLGEVTDEGTPPMLMRVWEEDGRMNMSLGEAGALPIERTHLVPLGDHRFARGRYRGDRLEGVDTVATTRFVVRGGVVSGVEHLVGGEVEFSARRVDSDSVLASLRAERSRVSVADIVAGALDTGGIDAARARHRELRSSRPDSVRFAQSLLDALGHRLLHEGRVPEAVAVFEMNVESWPQSPAAHGSLADAFRAAGNLEDASSAYERAIELAEQAEPMHLRTFRARLEEVKRRIEGAEEVAQRAGDGTADADTVNVAAPTEDETTDRGGILAALAQAQPGDVIRFAPGTYIVGEIIPIETAQLTLLGSANGTTLRGCQPDAYERMERDVEAAGDDQQARMAARLTCGVFEMTGGQGTVRGLTFEYTWVGLAIGAGHSSERRVTDGGYLVEDNVFRNSANGVRPGDLSGAPTVIRGNRFMNMGHAVSAGGAGIHVIDNDISVPDPDRLLSPQGPLFAIGIGPARECVVEGNRIEGHPSGIVLFGEPGEATRRNVIRDNMITVRGGGFALGLWGGQEDADSIEVVDNLIERNRIMGGVGVGIALNRASRNRILDNTIAGITLWDPSVFGEANGAGLWVSPGSDENEIVGNTFEDIAAHPIVLEGDRNVVQTRGVSEAVHDLGVGNRVTGVSGPQRHDATIMTVGR